MKPAALLLALILTGCASSESLSLFNPEKQPAFNPLAEPINLIPQKVAPQSSTTHLFD